MTLQPTIKSPEELQIMREAGKILAQIVEELSKEVVEGNTSKDIDALALSLCKKYKVKPAFWDQSTGAERFKACICANLNQVIVHGKPTNVKFKSGDIFGLDMGVIHKGYYSDMSVTIPIGKITPDVKEFLDKTYQSMMNGISEAKIGNTIGHISLAMRKGLLSGSFSLMKDFVGHGIGRALWEPPQVPALGMDPGQGVVLVEGMVLAIESMSVLGPSNAYELDKDGWTVWTKDKKYLSGLYEHTVIITKEGPEIITKL